MAATSAAPYPMKNCSSFCALRSSRMLASTSTGRRFSTSSTPAVLSDAHTTCHACLPVIITLPSQAFAVDACSRMTQTSAASHLMITNGCGAALSCIVNSSRIASSAPDADAGRPEVAIAHVSPAVEATGRSAHNACQRHAASVCSGRVDYTLGLPSTHSSQHGPLT